jgi:hypothetical protein
MGCVGSCCCDRRPAGFVKLGVGSNHTETHTRREGATSIPDIPDTSPTLPPQRLPHTCDPFKSQPMEWNPEWNLTPRETCVKCIDALDELRRCKQSRAAL